MGVRFHVLEHQGRLTRHGGQVKGVFHDEDDVNVFWIGLGGDERSKDNEAGQLAGRDHQLVNPGQPIRDGSPLDRALTEANQYI
jgi:hypothetical protein